MMHLRRRMKVKHNRQKTAARRRHCLWAVCVRAGSGAWAGERKRQPMEKNRRLCYNGTRHANTCACSSGDRAFDSDSKGRRFNSCQARHFVGANSAPLTTPELLLTSGVVVCVQFMQQNNASFFFANTSPNSSIPKPAALPGGIVCKRPQTHVCGAFAC